MYKCEGVYREDCVYVCVCACVCACVCVWSAEGGTLDEEVVVEGEHDIFIFLFRRQETIGR